jgi:hypothetical protein
MMSEGRLIALGVEDIDVAIERSLDVLAHRQIRTGLNSPNDGADDACISRRGGGRVEALGGTAARWLKRLITGCTGAGGESERRKRGDELKPSHGFLRWG